MLYETFRDFEEYFSISSAFTGDHFHRSIEIAFVFDLKADFLINNNPLTVNKGELLIIPPFTPHEYKESASPSLRIVFPSEYSELWEKQVKGKSLKSYVFSTSLAGELAKLLKEIPTATSLIKNGIYTYVLGKILDNAEFLPADKSKEPEFTTDVLKFIDERFSEDLTLEVLANKFGYSKYYFSNLFNKYFKMNVKTYLNKVRITKATTLLKKYSISKVSDMCGYNNLQSFFFNFKQITGFSPGEYLKSTTRPPTNTK